MARDHRVLIPATIESATRLQEIADKFDGDLSDAVEMALEAYDRLHKGPPIDAELTTRFLQGSAHAGTSATGTLTAGFKDYFAADDVMKPRARVSDSAMERLSEMLALVAAGGATKPPDTFRTARGVELPVGLEMFADYKNARFKAVVVPNGIEFEGTVYTDPSNAAVAAKMGLGVSRETAQTNGWMFWFYNVSDRKISAINRFRINPDATSAMAEFRAMQALKAGNTK